MHPTAGGMSARQDADIRKRKAVITCTYLTHAEWEPSLGRGASALLRATPVRRFCCFIALSLDMLFAVGYKGKFCFFHRT